MKKRVIWLLAALVALLCVLTVSAGATEVVASGECGAQGDNLTWTLDSTGVLMIEGSGAMADWEYRSAPWSLYESNIRIVVISKGTTSIGDYAFLNCEKLSSINIPDSIYSIGHGAFISCNGLTEIEIGGGVTNIKESAFANCDNLVSVTISDSVTMIETGAFLNCDNLVEIIVAEGNAAYASIDGILFNKDRTSLLQFPGGRSGNYTVSGTVRSIASYAFSNCDKLIGVVIDNGVTSIEDFAFYDCGKLENITIPTSIMDIGYYALVTYSDALKLDIYYGGTEKQWNAISFGYDAIYGRATIHFTEVPTVDAEISLENGVTPEFTVDTSTVTGTDNYAVISVGGKTERVEQADWADGKIFYDDIAMKDLTQTVTMCLYDAEGNLLTEQSVCVYDALKARLDAESNAQKKAEYTAQLHLAAAAQKYFDHNTGNLADKDLDGTVGDMSAHRKDESSLRGKDKSIIYGTSCVLGTQLQMKIYFTANDKDVFINGEKVELTASPTGGYYFYCMNVDPADIFENVSIEVKDGDTVLATAKDSVASYCARLYAMGGEKNETLADAMLNYGVAAKAAKV